MLFRNMKRRNPELIKNRKCPKRSKYGDGSLSVSLFLAAKLLVMWIVIVGMDFATGFRLEYIYPCWLMIQSVIDAYKYQGVGFTIFFISMVLMSDIFVYLIVPTTVMFFLASLYVWTQLMMHSGVERGFCVQTVVIWLVFLYLEATMRLRDIKLDSSSSSYFTWDICRPFAAHCVGYPLVTLSFTMKSFVGFKYRKHKQLQIATENRFFRDLTNDALPEENRRPLPEVAQPLDVKSISATKNGSLASPANGFMTLEQPVSPAGGGGPSTSGPSGSQSSQPHHGHSSESRAQKRQKHPATNTQRAFFSDMLVSMTSATKSAAADDNVSTSSSSASSSLADDLLTEPTVDMFLPTRMGKKNLNLEIENCDGDSVESEKAYRPAGGRSQSKLINRSNSPSVGGGKAGAAASAVHLQNNFEKESVSGNPGKKQKASTLGRDVAADLSPKQDDLFYSRLEGDLKKVKSDLNNSRQVEQELRSQVASLQSTEKSGRTEVVKLQQDNESLQQRLNNLVATRQVDKNATALMEKKLNDERKARQLAETQLQVERTKRKALEDAVPECSASCKNSRKDLDSEIRRLRADLSSKEEKMRYQGEEIHSMKQRQENAKDADVLSIQLASLQDRNAHLEINLTQEAKLKMDLFAALGQAKRELETAQNNVSQRDKDIGNLKQTISRLAEALNLLPANQTNQSAISGFLADASKQSAGNSPVSSSSSGMTSTTPIALSAASHRGLSSPDHVLNTSNHPGFN